MWHKFVLRQLDIFLVIIFFCDCLRDFQVCMISLVISSYGCRFMELTCFFELKPMLAHRAIHNPKFLEIYKYIYFYPCIFWTWHLLVNLEVRDVMHDKSCVLGDMDRGTPWDIRDLCVSPRHGLRCPSLIQPRVSEGTLFRSSHTYICKILNFHT